jgi:hypothetical protein
MRCRLAILILLPCLFLCGCKSYSGPLADFSRKIDPSYSQYLDLFRQRTDAKSNGDEQKVASLDPQLNDTLSKLQDAIDKAKKTEKGKEIPFVQTGSQDGYTMNKIVFTGADILGAYGQVRAHFEGHATLKSNDRRWRESTWQFVNKKGEVLDEGLFVITSDARSGEVVFSGQVDNLGEINKDLDRIVIP